MSYTPTSWSTGDTITASAMNKIENGIANAGGIYGLMISPDGFNAYSHILGFVGYFKQINNQWRTLGEGTECYWVNNSPTSYTLVAPSESSGMKVFWGVYAPDLDDVDVYFSGDINSTPATVYSNDGNISYNGYEITGVGYITVVAT